MKTSTFIFMSYNKISSYLQQRYKRNRSEDSAQRMPSYKETEMVSLTTSDNQNTRKD